MKSWLNVGLWLFFWLALVPHTHAQGSAFTYQGRLHDGAVPAEGTYDLTFTLHDAPTDGTVLGRQTNAATAVVQGVFTVTLNFGPGLFNGAARFLEIGVRTNGGSGFTTLSPRQQILPTPYAMYAGTAASVPNGAITASSLAAGAAAANLNAGGSSAVGGGGVILSEQANAPELTGAGFQRMARVDLVEEKWLARAPGPQGLPPVLAREDHSAVWTGTELIIWGGRDGTASWVTNSQGLLEFRSGLANGGARYNPATGIWTPLSTSNAPTLRYGHRAVWTGTEMIVWGGNVISVRLAGLGFEIVTLTTNTGARYNPATDVWTPITSGGPDGEGRSGHTALWTGSEMLVWGGLNFGNTRNTGARYNPSSGTWTTISSAGAPSVRTRYSAVLAGNEMIVWGGHHFIPGGMFSPGRHTNYNEGARYNLTANSWTPVTTMGAPFRRFSHSAVWDGTRMIVWGGRHQEGQLVLAETNYNDGAMYNPAANSWSPLASAGAPAARFNHDSAWDGTRMVIWGGTDGTNLFQTGRRYSPSGNAWSSMAASNNPVARSGHTTVATGSGLLVWGGVNGFLRDLGGHYNATADTWTVTTPTGERSERRGHSAVWTGKEMIVWGGFDGERVLNSGGRFDPAANTWQPILTNGAPAPRTMHTAVWTGTEMIVWGGTDPHSLNTGARYNPATGVWTPMNTVNAPSARHGHVAKWDGTRLLVWGGTDGTAFLNNGSRYQPANNTWSAITASGAPSARSGAAAVWTGTEMVVWGGLGGTVASPTPLADGHRYNPAANSWTTLPAANAPEARAGHRAIFTGDEMLIWGGSNLVSALATGGKYHRGSNTWSAITTKNAPAARIDHTAVLDGTRMIVWSGTASGVALNTGGIYNPLTDAWLTTQANSNAPTARAHHVAAWTGSEMVIHGGAASTNGLPLNDTWHYAPPRTMYLYLRP